MEEAGVVTGATLASFWRLHRPWVVDRWEVLVSGQVVAARLASKLAAAAYLDHKVSRFENDPEPEPEFLDLNALD